jgi:hypothetical protein
VLASARRWRPVRALGSRPTALQARAGPYGLRKLVSRRWGSLDVELAGHHGDREVERPITSILSSPSSSSRSTGRLITGRLGPSEVLFSRPSGHDLVEAGAELLKPESHAAFDRPSREAELRGDLGVGELTVEGERDHLVLGGGK